MLNVYYGDNTLNREKFIFDNIDFREKTILIVPDQYSLKAEQNAFEYLETDSLVDLMVTDFSSLGHKVVSKAGIREDKLIDKYGRYMLLSQVTNQLSDELSVFGNIKDANSFIDLMDDMVSGMKRYGVTSSDIAKCLEEGESSNWLKFKLEDIYRIYSAYENAVEGKYVDPEDYIRLYGDLMSESEIIRGASIWIYGFDTFTPLNFLIMGKLAAAAKQVNVVITKESEDNASHAPRDARIILPGEGEGLFDLSNYIMQKLRETVETEGIQLAAIPIDEAGGGAAGSGSLWSNPSKECITLVEASNVYEEAERAALYIMKLVRDEGYRFGEIAVICNDMDVRVDILERSLQRWGIPCFTDRRRNALHQPAVSFIMSLLDMATSGLRTESVIPLLKTGLTDVIYEDCELVENYVKEHNVKGSAWTREFTKNRGSYSPAELLRINEIRQELVDFILKAKDEIGRRNTAGEKIRGLYSFLEDNLSMRDKIAALVDKQEEFGLTEGAAETSQSWNIICEIFDQIVRIAGDRHVSNEVLKNLIYAGFEKMDIGIVPQSSDCVIMGTMQRTRLSNIRALLVVGVNEGVLPSGRDESGLLSRSEIRSLEDMGIIVSGSEEMARQEEQLAMYRMFSAPSERLYVSCASSDEDGKSAAPSGVFTALCELLGDDAVSRSIDPAEFIASSSASVPYIADAIREYSEKGNVDSQWLHAMKWYRENIPQKYEMLMRGVLFSNRAEALGEELAEKVFAGEDDVLRSSASRMEKYSLCPFAHFMDYGLRALEQREYRVDSRDIGTVYHDCLMQFSEKLTSGDGAGIRGENSPWMTMSKDECHEMIGEILAEDSGLCDGVFESGGESEFRMRRIWDVCSDVAWALVCQVRSGQIREMHFEEKFNDEIACGDNKAIIRGSIDRMDVIDVAPGESGDARKGIRIVDYKTGNNSIDPDQFRSGYKLQLMTYMNAAVRKVEADPAGVYYFKIRDFIENDTGKTGTEPLDKKLQNAYRLEGLVPDDYRMICAMDENMERAASESSSEKSSVIPIKYVKKDDCFAAAGGGTLITTDEFKELCSETSAQTERICSEIYEGRIDISPAREKNRDMDGKRVNACKYCRYKSICMFDRAFADCRYREV